MSESEKAARAEYQQRRKKIIYIILAVALVLSVLTASFSIIFTKLDANTYVDYQESGSAVYHAYLNENEYYKEESLNGSHAYISSLIHHMDIDFTYKSDMNVPDVTYKYKYRVDARMVIQDEKSGAPIYNPVETIIGPESKEYDGENPLTLKKSVNIDYVKYNEKAKEVIEKYDLRDVTSYLDVTMYVDVVGMSEAFAADSEGGSYTVNVRIPLTQNVLKPQVTSTIPAGPQKILANPNEGKTVFMVLAIVFGVLTAAAIVFLVVYILKTRDEHIDYTRKVQKIVNSYKSFIQKLRNPFDSTGYQILEIDSFNEMLEIRDTLQLPILMHENEDKTCTVFMIPVDSKLLYSFEIKVDNYDEIYAPETLGDDAVNEEELVEATEELLALEFEEDTEGENVEETEIPDVEEETTEETEIPDVEEETTEETEISDAEEETTEETEIPDVEEETTEETEISDAEEETTEETEIPDV